MYNGFIIGRYYFIEYWTISAPIPISNGGWRRHSMPQPTTNLTNQCRDSISVDGVVIVFKFFVKSQKWSKEQLSEAPFWNWKLVELNWKLVELLFLVMIVVLTF